MPTLGFPSTREAQFVLLELALDGRDPEPAGILLLDPASDRVHLKLLSDFSRMASDAEDLAVLEGLQDHLEQLACEWGGERLLAWMEDTLSHTLRLTERRMVALRDPSTTAERLFEEHVLGKEKPRVRVLPFRTHVPVYTLRAAATKFGEDMEVEPAGWVQPPSGVRMGEGLFAARVVGRSMEPRIPDGSLCLFRANVTGSRQGKLVLVRRKAASSSGGEFTIKRYRSEKTVSEEGWGHRRIRLEPLNPEFEAWDLEEGEFSVLGEFVAVLDDESSIDSYDPEE
jgi:SOS-response transcriptional repressor LexA